MSGGIRKPRVREDYTADAQLMLNLSRAVQADSARPASWRGEIVDSLKLLAERLINAPELDTQLDLLSSKKDT